MALGSVYLNARARALIGSITPPAELARLAAAASVDDVIRALDTAGWFRYPELNGLAPAERLYAELDADYRAAMTVLEGAGRRVVRAMYRRIEAEFLKSVLGCAWRGVPRSVRPSLIGAARLLERDREAPLLAAETLDDAVRHVPAPYDAVVANALHRVAEENSLFPLESALDLFVLHEMWLAGRALDGNDRAHTGRILGTWFDSFNIGAATRLRLVYGVRGDEALGYLIHHGQLLGLSHRRALANAGSLDEIRAALRDTPYAAALADATSPRDGEKALAAIFADRLRDELSGYPFHVGGTIAYLFLREIEVRSLARIIEAKRRAGAPRLVARGG